MSSEDAKDDGVADTSIGFVFDAFGDSFKIINSRVDFLQESMYKLSSKIEALDIGIVYSADIFDKKIEAITKSHLADNLYIKKKFNSFRSIMLFVTSLSFILNISLLIYIMGA